MAIGWEARGHVWGRGNRSGGVAKGGGVARWLGGVANGADGGVASSAHPPPSSVLLAPPPDRYVIVGARRDSLGPGAAASGVGTALLLELARVLGAMARAGELPHMAP